MISNRNNLILSKFKWGPKTAQIIPTPLENVSIVAEQIMRFNNSLLLTSIAQRRVGYHVKYSRLSLSRNRRDSLKHFEISVLRHIRFIVLKKKQLEQPNFINDYVI